MYAKAERTLERKYTAAQQAEYNSAADYKSAPQRSSSQRTLLLLAHITITWPWKRNASSSRPIATDVEVMRYITGGIPWSDEQIQSSHNDPIGFSEIGWWLARSHWGRAWQPKAPPRQ